MILENFTAEQIRCRRRIMQSNKLSIINNCAPRSTGIVPK